MGIRESIEIGLREEMLPFRNLNDALHHTTALGTALRGISPQAAEVFYLLEKEQVRHSFPNVHVMKDFAQKMEMFWLGAARNLSPIFGEPAGGSLEPQAHAYAWHYVECIYTTLIHTKASHGLIPHYGPV